MTAAPPCERRVNNNFQLGEGQISERADGPEDVPGESLDLTSHSQSNGSPLMPPPQPQRVESRGSMEVGLSWLPAAFPGYFPQTRAARRQLPPGGGRREVLCRCAVPFGFCLRSSFPGKKARSSFSSQPWVLAKSPRPSTLQRESRAHLQAFSILFILSFRVCLLAL